MNWFERRRLAWIAETLRVFGFINRGHLMRKFGISQPQASKDLATFDKRQPGMMRYDTSAKCYRACLDYRPDHNGECLNCDEPLDAHPRERRAGR